MHVRCSECGGVSPAVPDGQDPEAWALSGNWEMHPAYVDEAAAALRERRPVRVTEYLVCPVCTVTLREGDIPQPVMGCIYGG